jgi:LysM repeat protein
MPAIDTALENSAVGENYVSSANSPTIEEAFGGPEHLELRQGALDGWDNEELKDEQTAATTPPESASTQHPASAAPEETSVSSNDGAQAYTVISGDTLSQIAEDNGVTLQALIAANPHFTNPDLIYPGDKVTIPTEPAIAADTQPNQVDNTSTSVNYEPASDDGSLRVAIPPPRSDPLYDEMGWVPDTQAGRQQAFDVLENVKQSNQIMSTLNDF